MVKFAWLFKIRLYNRNDKPMINPSLYWKLVKINAAGNCQIQSIISAQTFFYQLIGESVNLDNLSHNEVQLQLLNLPQQASDYTRMVAKRCLLCFISWEIEKVCLNLEKKFGLEGGFTKCDLLAYVLDDDGRLPQTSSYRCYSLEILQSFDIRQSSLSSWTSRKVKQHPDLGKFLLEYGIYLSSDWAILNDTQLPQLKRILSEFHSLTVTEIQQYKWLLQSYHTIYRAQRLQQRRSRTSRCQSTTTEQLQQIVMELNKLSSGNYGVSTIDLMAQLQQLADYLREYRIYVRGGALNTESIDIAKNDIPDPSFNDNEENQVNEFLELYRSQFLKCLDNAIATVTQARVNALQRRNADRANQFLNALELFHCQGLSMTQIAERIQMQAQFQVTRLLRLREFRADVTHELLILLRPEVSQLAQNYFSLERLRSLESQITIALREQIEDLNEEARTEAFGERSNSSRSQFAQSLCEYLDSRE